ncbi:MAG: hypothetical protein K6G89_06765 [Clostridia bacterium]|nr:hypothetical protein [Clostridia bacterium]
MDNEFRHFNIGFKAVAIVLVLAVFATLIPTRIFIDVYAEDPGATLTDPDYAALSGFPETTESEYESDGITLPDKSDEYEQLALEKLGQPATVEKWTVRIS